MVRGLPSTVSTPGPGLVHSTSSPLSVSAWLVVAAAAVAKFAVISCPPHDSSTWVAGDRTTMISVSPTLLRSLFPGTRSVTDHLSWRQGADGSGLLGPEVVQRAGVELDDLARFVVGHVGQVLGEQLAGVRPVGVGVRVVTFEHDVVDAAAGARLQ